MKKKYAVGQRWMSETEPELGLGHITRVEHRMISLSFGSGGETRSYRSENAPLKRFVLAVGQTAKHTDGSSLVIADVKENNGIIFYLGDQNQNGGLLPETDLADLQSAPKEDFFDRILEGHFDTIEAFELRQNALELKSEISQSPVRGLSGPRIDLIPHQFYIAHKATSEARLPRRLLSDEVGLGKTIEAGMIWHRLKVTSRVTRTLILVPESLKHQWMVEMYRRFNTMFTIVDEEYIDSLDVAPDEVANPFKDKNEILCDIQFLEKQPKYREHILKGKWDLVIVDEAHRIAPIDPEDLENALHGQSERDEDDLMLESILGKLSGSFPMMEEEEIPDLTDEELAMLADEFSDDSAAAASVNTQSAPAPEGEDESGDFDAEDQGLRIENTFAPNQMLYDLPPLSDFPSFESFGRTPSAPAEPMFDFLQKLSKKTPGLLLLSATPVQLQMKAHFSRLQLLDPVKFSDFEAWKNEYETYHELAHQLENLLIQCAEAHKKGHEILELLPAKSSIRQVIEAIPDLEHLSAIDVIRHLNDTIGTGRSVVRNTRAAIGGFPERKLHAYPCEIDLDYRDHILKFNIDDDDFLTDAFKLNASLALGKDFFTMREAELLPTLWCKDEKVKAVAKLLNTKLKNKKVLILSATRETALALQETLGRLTPREYVVFHEDVPLVARDRAAAWFADPDGASCLIASEIGSEGRNFQFAHDLVLFDLPIEAGLLEQRIGRLDRIGQKATVEIHVPFVIGTAQEVLYKWYHNGLNAFLAPLMGVEAIHAKHEEFLSAAIADPETLSEAKLDEFLQSVSVDSKLLRVQVEKGRDRLLEFNSYDHDAAQKLTEIVKSEDNALHSESFTIEALEYFGADVQAGRTANTWSVHPGEKMKVDEFPGLSEEGFTLTSSRPLALAREDLVFLSGDHPIVHGALDLVLASEIGITSCCSCKSSLPKGIYAEYHFVVECATKPEWNLQSYMTTASIHFVLDHRGKERADILEQLRMAPLEDTSHNSLESALERLTDLSPIFKDSAHILADEKSNQHIGTVRKNVEHALLGEIRRLRSFIHFGPQVKKRLDELEGRLREVEKSLQSPQLRLDSMRLILSH